MFVATTDVSMLCSAVKSSALKLRCQTRERRRYCKCKYVLPLGREIATSCKENGMSDRGLLLVNTVDVGNVHQIRLILSCASLLSLTAGLETAEIRYCMSSWTSSICSGTMRTSGISPFVVICQCKESASRSSAVSCVRRWYFPPHLIAGKLQAYCHSLVGSPRVPNHQHHHSSIPPFLHLYRHLPSTA